MPEEAKVHGNTKKAADMALAKRAISPDSHKAVHEGRITLDEARELGREGSPFGPAPKAISKNDRTPTKTACLCGCGELVPRTFNAGHDVRLVSLAKAYVRGERELTEEQLEYVTTSGKLDRAKAQVAKEDAKRQEQERRKAERPAKAEAKSKK
jgi:hypothetical protein